MPQEVAQQTVRGTTRNTFTEQSGPQRGREVTVLLGGPSAERKVSLNTGRAVADALRSLGHCVTQADVGPDNLAVLEKAKNGVVFIALHGEFGEDGQLQRILEERGIFFTGSDSWSSQLAMDKPAAKQAFIEAGLFTPMHTLVDRSWTARQRRLTLVDTPLPSVVKPPGQGSSVDVKIVLTPEQLHTAVDLCLNLYGAALVEDFVRGREMTVTILGEEPLPIIEIQPANAFYDYASKYKAKGTRYLDTPDLPQPLYRQIQWAALKAHQVLGCRDLSRVDLILDANNRPMILELNTIPGMTERSLVPKAAAAAGMDFAQLCQQLLERAVMRKDIVMQGTTTN